MMIHIITSPSSSSSRKAKMWLSDHGLDHAEHCVTKNNPLTTDMITHMLGLSMNGFSEICSMRSAAVRSVGGFAHIEQMTTQQAIQFIINNPKLLRYPIIYDETRLQVGYKIDEMSKFFSRKRRQQEMYQITGIRREASKTIGLQAISSEHRYRLSL